MIDLVKGHDGYYVRDNGQIFSFKGKDQRMLKPFFSKDRLVVKIDGKQMSVANIVACAFVKNDIGENARVFHLDGDPTNNSKYNLVWVTTSEMRKLKHVPTWDRRVYLKGLRGETDSDEFYDECDLYGELEDIDEEDGE